MSTEGGTMLSCLFSVTDRYLHAEQACQHLQLTECALVRVVLPYHAKLTMEVVSLAQCLGNSTAK